jgi:hypothetical protein
MSQIQPLTRNLLNSEMNKFLHASGIRIRIAGRRKWTPGVILRLMMIALRSETDVLSGWYPSFHVFWTYVNRLNIVDEPVPSRGRVLPNETWDMLVNLYQKSNRPFPYEETTMRGSKHLYECTSFMEALGLNSEEGYLETRSWFGRSADLQRMTLEVVLRGNGRLIDVFAPDFREHITSLLRAT